MTRKILLLLSLALLSIIMLTSCGKSEEKTSSVSPMTVSYSDLLGNVSSQSE